MQATFNKIIDGQLINESQELRNYLKACYILRSDFFLNGSPNEYQKSSTLLPKNRNTLLNVFPDLNRQTAENIVNIWVTFELENLGTKKVNEILEKKKRKDNFNSVGKASKKHNYTGEIKPQRQIETPKKADPSKQEKEKKQVDTEKSQSGINKSA